LNIFKKDIMRIDMPEIDILGTIIILMVLSLIYTLLTPHLLSLQASMGIGQLRKSMREIETFAIESRAIALRSFSKHGRTKRDIRKEIENSLEFFAIEPVREDPVGVLRRLEHILDVRKKRFESLVKKLSPKADEETAANLEMVLEGAIATHTLYRLMKHYCLLAEKTKSYQLVMILQMQLPFLKEYAKAFTRATKTFAEGKPIGDGVGPLTAVLIANTDRWKEEVEDTVYAEVPFEGRTLLVVKAKGPGGRVGKPGELIRRLAKKRKINRIIMIDAAAKLEGERSGEVVEGVGAAIGGPPVDKYKIEEIATELGIPLDAVIIKESLVESITEMHKGLAEGARKAAEVVKRAILERTKPKDTILIAGIGNTIGIGQSPKEIPREFPQPPVLPKGAIESAVLPIG